MNKTTKLLILMLSVISGCVAVDTSTKTLIVNQAPATATVSQASPQNTSTKTDETAEVKPTNPSPDKTLKRCLVYIPPEIPVVKPAPLAKFGETPIAKQQEREAILLEYIKDLRTHIASAKKAHADNYKNYVARCAGE